MFNFFCSLNHRLSELFILICLWWIQNIFSFIKDLKFSLSPLVWKDWPEKCVWPYLAIFDHIFFSVIRGNAGAVRHHRRSFSKHTSQKKRRKSSRYFFQMDLSRMSWYQTLTRGVFRKQSNIWFMIELFAEIVQWLKTVNYFLKKAPS